MPKPSDQFIDHTHELFICPVCLEVPAPDEACELNCGHIFCKNCIDRSLQTRSVCPNCQQKQPSTPRVIARENPFVFRQLRNLQIRCDYWKINNAEEQEVTCDWVGPFSELEKHLNEYHVQSENPLTMIACPFKKEGCTHQFQRNKLNEHMQEHMIPHMLLLSQALKHKTEIIENLTQLVQKQDKIIREQEQMIKQHGQAINNLKVVQPIIQSNVAISGLARCKLNHCHHYYQHKHHHHHHRKR
eukprot:GEZU01033962.1.p1 GENE.GEZU01033962.1~~GEZU01033962.1.p1  ORF type:complete len:244 (-),score=52.44 GEZU01033962.1:63-794(-)